MIESQNDSVDGAPLSGLLMHKAFYFQQSLIYFMLGVTFAITSSLLIEAHFEIGGDRTVAMIRQINEAMSEYVEYHEVAINSGSIRSDEQSNDGDHAEKDALEDNSVFAGGADGEVNLQQLVVPLWTKYHLLFAAVRIPKFVSVKQRPRTERFSSSASCAVLNASYVC